MLAMTNTTYLLAAVAVVGGIFLFIMLVKLLLKAAIFAVALIVVYLFFAPGVGLPGITAIYHKITGQVTHVATPANAHKLAGESAKKAERNKKLRHTVKNAIISELTATTPGLTPRP